MHVGFDDELRFNSPAYLVLLGPVPPIAASPKHDDLQFPDISSVCPYRVSSLRFENDVLAETWA